MKKDKIWILLNIFLLVLFLFLANNRRNVNILPLTVDSLQNAWTSYYLANNGIYSEDGKNLTYFREPFPNFLNSIYIKYFTSIDEKVSPQEMISEQQYLKQLTFINIVFLGFVFFSIWWLVYLLTQSHRLVWLAVIFPVGYYTIDTWHSKRLLTELPSTFLFLIAVGLMIVFYKNGRLLFAVLSGIFFGLLALSKAVFLPLLFPFFFITIIYLYRFHSNRIKGFILIFSCFILTVLPWMIRNKVVFDDFAISERGGIILLIRAIKNQMTDEEFWGGFYAYAPKAIQSNFFEPFFGFNPNDLEVGGYLVRLNRFNKNDVEAINSGNPENTLSYLQQTIRIRIPELYKKAELNSELPDKLIKDEAMDMIISNPINHLKLSFLFAWRGIWIYLGNHLVVSIFNLLIFISFWIVFTRGILRNEPIIILFTSIPFLYFLFHLFFTHYIPRYSLLIMPFWSISLVFIFHKLKFYPFHNNV